MSSLKDLIIKDNETLFFCDQDFAELHTIDKKELLVVVDNEVLADATKGALLGVTEAEYLVYARTNELDISYTAGDIINYDGYECIVDRSIETDGVTQIFFHKNSMY